MARRSRPRPSLGPRDPTPTPARRRFRSADAAFAAREWHRLEGTAQRRLFRELRRRVLRRHAPAEGWVLDAGAGPGRFTADVGGPATRRVALDLSRAMLLALDAPATGRPPARVVADLLRAPFADGTFSEVVALGNTIGFNEERAPQALERAERLVAPGGLLLVEVAPAPGEYSGYLARLPPSVVARTLRAPARAVLARLDREPFHPEPARRRSSPFYRLPAQALIDRWSAAGWALQEAVAIAPGSGALPDLLEAVARDPAAWERLLELEEAIGLRPARWTRAAAVVLVARRPPRRHD